MINYFINEEGVLSVYYNNCIIAEISECNNMSIEQIDKLVKEIYKESELCNMLINKEKEKFLNYCKMFNKELEDLQEEIDFENAESYNGTLAYIGANFSYELANIGFGLCYASWHFKINGTFDEIKNDFINTIMSNEKLDDLRTIGELKDIERRLKNAMENSDN